MLRAAEIVFPHNTASQSETLAWTKLIAALPPSMRETLSLLDTQGPTEALLENIDKTWRSSQTTPCAATESKPDPLATLQTTLAAIEKRLQSLETGEPCCSTQKASTFKRRFGKSPSSHGTLCWYHVKFGNHAKRCEQPCSYSSRHSGNYKGAPSP
jgi:hypothetical protein